MKLMVRHEGPYVVAYARFRMEGGFIELRCAVDSRTVRTALAQSVRAARASGDEVGFINFKKLGRGIARAARNVARSSALRSVLSTASAVVNNPLISAVLPGASAVSTALRAVSTSDRARRGDPRARQAVARLSEQARQGDPVARAAVRTVRLCIPAEIHGA